MVTPKCANLYVRWPNRQSHRTQQWHTSYSPRPPTLSQGYMDLRVWSYLESSYIFQVSWKSVQGFQSHDVLKFALSHWLGDWLIQQLVLPYKPWQVTTVADNRPPCTVAGVAWPAWVNAVNTLGWPRHAWPGYGMAWLHSCTDRWLFTVTLHLLQCS